MKTFYYTNTLGFNKMLDIDETPNAEGKYHCMLWSADNGELCGFNYLSIGEIREYFRNNKIEGTFDPKTEEGNQ